MPQDIQQTKLQNRICAQDLRPFLEVARERSDNERRRRLE